MRRGASPSASECIVLKKDVKHFDKNDDSYYSNFLIPDLTKMSLGY